jgi:hypothetical protein
MTIWFFSYPKTWINTIKIPKNMQKTILEWFLLLFPGLEPAMHFINDIGGAPHPKQWKN